MLKPFSYQEMAFFIHVRSVFFSIFVAIKML